MGDIFASTMNIVDSILEHLTQPPNRANLVRPQDLMGAAAAPPTGALSPFQQRQAAFEAERLQFQQQFQQQQREGRLREGRPWGPPRLRACSGHPPPHGARGPPPGMGLPPPPGGPPPGMGGPRPPGVPPGGDPLPPGADAGDGGCGVPEWADAPWRAARVHRRLVAGSCERPAGGPGYARRADDGGG